MKQGMRTAGREVAMTPRVLMTVFPRAGISPADELASPGSAGDRGIVVEVSRL